VKTPHVSSKPPGLNLGNRDSTNRVLGTIPAPKGHSPAIVLSGDNLWCPVLGTEKNSMVLRRRIQLEDAQCRPAETGSQLGHGDRKNNFVDLDGAK
jgi:hypothetical protein